MVGREPGVRLSAGSPGTQQVFSSSRREHVCVRACGRCVSVSMCVREACERMQCVCESMSVRERMWRVCECEHERVCVSACGVCVHVCV